MNYKMKKIGIVSTIKVTSTFGIVFGIVYGIIATIMMAFTIPGTYLGQMILLMLILGPVMGALSGLIGGAFMAGIFNLLCRILGGIEININEQALQS